jgi:hypothetical protein
MGNTWLLDVQGPLTVPVLMQYVHVCELDDWVQLRDGDDTVAWRWCGSGKFSSSSAYEAMFLSQSEMQGAKQLWKARASAEHKFFFSGSPSRTGAGQMIAIIGMASLMMRVVRYVCNMMRGLITYCSIVCTIAKYGS